MKYMIHKKRHKSLNNPILYLIDSEVKIDRHNDKIHVKFIIVNRKREGMHRKS